MAEKKFFLFGECSPVWYNSRMTNLNDLNADRSKKIMVRRGFNVELALWDKCMDRAKSKGQSLSAVIKMLLIKWLNGEFDF